MNAVKFPKNWKVYLCFAAAAIALFFTYPEKGDFTYRYHRGSPWIYDNLVAPFSFPILKTPQELSDEMEAKSNEVIDYYLYDEGVCEEEINAFTAHIHRDSVADSIYANAVPVVISTLDEIYNRGVVSDFNDDKKDGIIFIKRGKRVKEVPAAEVYSLQEARKEIISAISTIEGISNPDSVAIVLNLKSFIVPNMTFDAATTAQVHKEAIDYISPTKGTFYSGQLIVSNGEIVTAELEQILDSFKAEYNASYGYYGSDLEAVAYKLMIVVLIIILFFFALLFANSEILNQTNSYLFFLTLFAILFITISVVNDHFSSYILAIPFSVYLLYSMAFFPAAVVFPSYAVALLPLLVIPENGTLLFFMNLFAGGALLLSYNRFHRGWTQFINCIVVFIAIFAVYMTFTLMGNHGLIKTDIIHLGIHSVLILALYPVVFLLERIFSFISDVRLW
ncbi:MAG: hypothetical protein HUJ90_01005, partial [Bacteroidales bacterium]|nr:hypothetical protein [Bacteroidales bacterium]